MYYGYTSLDGYSWERNRCIASPGWQEESVGKNEVELSVYVVNPLSNHQEEAIMYLTYETKHWPAYINGKLYADTEPTITTFGMELIAELRQMAEDWRNEIPNEPDEQRRELYAKFAEGYEEQAQRYYDEPSHWAYYAPALEAYRANVVPNLFTQTTRLLEGSDQTHAPVWDELTKAVQQYLEGFTSLDQCVQRLGQIARMLALEE